MKKKDLLRRLLSKKRALSSGNDRKSNGRDIESKKHKKGRKELLKEIKVEYGHSFSSLFSPCSRQKSREGVKISFKVCLSNKKWDEVEYRFRCPEKLDTFDMKVFLAILSSIQNESPLEVVNPLEKSPLEEKKQNKMDPKNQKLIDVLLVKGENAKMKESFIYSKKGLSVYSILKKITKDRSKKSIEAFNRSIKRLSTVEVFVYCKKNGKVAKKIASTLLGFVTDESTNKIYITLNPVISKAILGTPLTGYVPKIDERVFSLRGIASILLLRLCSWLGKGKKGKVSISVLEKWIYGENTADSIKRSKRKRKIKRALLKIGSLKGWQIIERNGEVYLIFRI